MKHGLSKKTKDKRKMGKGSGANYKSRIRVREFNSLGTTAIVIDWKTKRTVNCLSQGEMLWYYVLRWDDENEDVLDQYKLDEEKTIQMAEHFGIRHPVNPHTKEKEMTTDFLVIRKDGTRRAYSVKPNRDLSDRTCEKLFIEQAYWKDEGVDFEILFTSDVNRILSHNIRLAVEFYDANRVFDKYSLIKHLIATKKINADLTQEIIECKVLDRYANQIEGVI